MLVNELTFYELKRIITPVVQLQSMSRVCSEIGTVLRISKPTRKEIQEQNKQFLLRYKGFEVFLRDLRWLRGRGPSIQLQFSRPATKWETLLNNWFAESHRWMDRVCGEVVQDLKSICLKEMPEVKLTSTDVTAPADYLFHHEEGEFRVAYPNGAFNDDWQQGNQISPLMITDESHSGKWFISFSFNPGAFVRRGEKTILRDNWQEYANDISESVEAEVTRMLGDGSRRTKSFDEWSEDMILDFGDEIAPQLPSIWQRIHRPRDQGEGQEGASRQP
jgi:hypothetical protein